MKVFSDQVPNKNHIVCVSAGERYPEVFFKSHLPAELILQSTPFLAYREALPELHLAWDIVPRLVIKEYEEEKKND